MKFEFTTAACLRPELLKITYSTLSNFLLDVDTKSDGVLYINIDQYPQNDENKKIDQILSIANKYFKEVHFRIGEAGGNFSAAMDWLFSQPKNEYFFNLEEDWRAISPISITGAINKIKYSNKKKPLQYVFFPTWENLCRLGPSVFNAKVLKELLEKFPFQMDIDPEHTLMQASASNKSKTEDGFAYSVLSSENKIFEDIGRTWMKKWLQKNNMRAIEGLRATLAYRNFKPA